MYGISVAWLTAHMLSLSLSVYSKQSEHILNLIMKQRNYIFKVQYVGRWNFYSFQFHHAEIIFS